MLGVAMLGVAGDMRGAVVRCFVRLFFCAALPLLLLLLAQRGKGRTHGTVGLKAKEIVGRFRALAVYDSGTGFALTCQQIP